jgi:ATP-dependent helicase/nuclease subunit B
LNQLLESAFGKHLAIHSSKSDHPRGLIMEAQKHAQARHEGKSTGVAAPTSMCSRRAQCLQDWLRNESARTEITAWICLIMKGEKSHLESETTIAHLFVSSIGTARLAAARSWLHAMPTDAEILIIATHMQAANELTRTVVSEGGSRFGVQRLTPGQLASRIAAPELARRELAPSTSLSLAAVVARAVHRALEEGRIDRFAGVARRPGFAHAVVQTFEDLRAAGVLPGRVRDLAGSGKSLAALQGAIEDEMERLKLVDRAAIFEIAIAELAKDNVSGVEMPILLLDLALEDPLVQRLIATITERSPRILATAAEGDRTAIQALSAMLGTSGKVLAGEDASSLSCLQRHLFEETAPEARQLDDSVSLSSWPGEARECIEIARRMQAEAAKGMPFDHMAVFLRAPGAYRADLEEALRRASIPAWFAVGTTRPDPSGRALLALLACKAEGLSARRFAEYVSLAQVPQPGEPAEDSWTAPQHELMPISAEAIETDGNDDQVQGENPIFDPRSATLAGTLRAPWRWERLLVDAAVIGGADRWRRRLAGLAAELSARRGELNDNDAHAASLERTAADLEHLREFALPLVERLATLPSEATWADWLLHLRALVAAAIRQPSGVLSVLAELEPMGPVGPVDLATVQHVLTPRLRELTVFPETRPNGAVFVGPVETARGLEFDIVFVPGLAEKLFPQRILQDPLLPDHARLLLGAPGLATQDSRVAAERLALRLAAGAAKQHLALSWPRIDIDNARPRVPSFYALEALRAAEGRLPGFDEITSRAELSASGSPGWPAPERPQDAIDDSEYDLSVLARLKDTDPAANTGAAAYLLSANPYLRRALRARARRWIRRWTSADGLVEPDEEALAALARHRIGARPFSPTSLENFSACPYRFLLQAIHGLRPREEIEAIETLDPLTRGALIHEIQFRVLTVLRDHGHLPLDPKRLDTAFAHLDAEVTHVSEEYRERFAPAILRVWEDGIDAIRIDMREWLRRIAEAAGEWIPHRFELAFGLPEHLRRAADSASVTEPVAVLDGVLLRGSIDLIERRADGALRVTDNKSGKARVEANAVISGGQALQPILYALAAETILKSPVESGRLYYCTSVGDFTERTIAIDTKSRAEAKVATDAIRHSIEQGFLPAAPLKDACGFCNYRAVCGPLEYLRTSRKPTGPIAELLALRDRP